MWDAVFHALADAPQAYAILFAVAALDAVVPAVPSETALILAGLLSVEGSQLALHWVIVSAAAGALVGDTSSYALGRHVGHPLRRRFFDGPRSRAAMSWAATQLDRRGGTLIIVARFVPGGRTAVTLTCGMTRFPLRSFAPFAVAAACLWAVYGGALGYLGGRVFHDRPWLALLVAFGIAAVSEAWQRRRSG